MATGEASIESFLATPHADSLFFASNSQNSGYSNNDAFICTQSYHPILKTVLEVVHHNYTGAAPIRPDAKPQLYENASDAPIPGGESGKWKDSRCTMFRSGPQALATTLAG